ncbi:MAG TPA: LysR family transcriptional regulator [Bacillota bacterium]|nr:LysR family transcriptional regulator [Bacillota bacterium]
MLFKNALEIIAHKRLSGDDLFTLLENIMLYGSISRAAAEAGVSYRYAWGLIQESEKAMQATLVDKYVGGYAGGGALLTAKGKKLLQEYKAYKQAVDHRLEQFMQQTFRGETQATKAKEMKRTDYFLLLASTLEPVEAGLLDELEGAYYLERGVLIRHLAAGSGRALEIAKSGRVDMTFTHAPELEEQFMAEGWGACQAAIMSSDFILVGSPGDPAGLGRAGPSLSVAEAFRLIADSHSPFITRGDHSGTHLRETAIWEKCGIIPGGDWYLFYPGVAGNLGALRFAREKGAYILVDRASFYLSRSEAEMKIFIGEDDPAPEELANTFVLTAVNPDKIPSVQLEEASRFMRWLQKEKGRAIIDSFGRESYREPLFKLSS